MDNAANRSNEPIGTCSIQDRIEAFASVNFQVHVNHIFVNKNPNKAQKSKDKARRIPVSPLGLER